MKKTLAEILSEPANVQEIIRTATAINKLIEDSKKAGVVWPEIEEQKTPVYSPGDVVTVIADGTHNYPLGGKILVVNEIAHNVYNCYGKTTCGNLLNYGMFCNEIKLSE